MKSWFTKKDRLLAGTIIAGASVMGFAAPAVAQDEAASSAEEEIIVTGSRIARRDAVAESPILTVTQEEMTESGYVTVDHYLNTLPQIVPGISSQSNNPSSNGRAFLDLRGLGPARNLVLMDGRRPMGSLSGGTVDVNTVPTALIESTEIITGGAAATYGADAVAGVVNFIMRDSYDGFAMDSQYRITEQGDGKEWGVDFTLGEDFADGRGSAVFNVNYFNRDPMYKDAREFSAQASATTGTFPGGSYTVGANSPTQAAVDLVFGPGLCQPGGGGAGFGFNPDGTLFCTGVQANATFDVVGYNGPEDHIATAFFPDLFSYNFEPDNILVLPLERWNLYSHVSLDLNNHFRPYARGQFTNYNALQELAPTPANGFTVPVTNPFVPDDLADLLASRTTPGAVFTLNKRFNDIGGRTGFNNHDVWQTMVGVEGDLTETWTYDVYASYGRSVQTEIQGGNIRLVRVEQLLDDPNGGAGDEVFTPGADADNINEGVICEGGLNLFGAAPISQACQDFISLEAKNLTVLEQEVVEATVQGDLFNLPAGAVKLLLGTSFRSLDFDFKPDSGLQPGQVAGFNEQLPISGYLDYFDLFGEVFVPIVTDAPFAKNISLTAGFRQTDNNQSGAANSWKVTGDWTITDWLRFRGGLQEAIRSPNIAELFAPRVNNFPSISNSDPCNTSVGGAALTTHPLMGRNGANGADVQALCAAQAAVAGGATFNQPFGQSQAIIGGNPDLSPETAESWTIGFVVNAPFETDWLDSVYLSLDYWSIELADQIGAFGAVTVLQRCFNRDNANPTYDINNAWCQLFTRDQSDGRVINQTLTQNNDQRTSTSGLDIAFGWGFNLGSVGNLDFNVLATWWESFKNGTTVGATDPFYEFAGTIGSGTGSATPEWKATFNTAYSISALKLEAQARWIDAMEHNLDVTSGVVDSAIGTHTTWYLDLRGTYDLTETLTLRAGINNVLDEDPRLYNPNVQSNTDPSTYDVLGRRFFVGFNLRM